MTQANVNPAPSQPTTRRDFLGTACAASGCAACAFAVAPAVSYLIPRPSNLPSGPVDVGPDEVPEGGFKQAKVGPINLLIVRSEGKLTCVNAKCTHLAGLVEWDGQAKGLKCPIHGATFDVTGANPTSPAPRPLKPFPIQSVDGRLIVTF